MGEVLALRALCQRGNSIGGRLDAGGDLLDPGAADLAAQRSGDKTHDWQFILDKNRYGNSAHVVLGFWVNTIQVKVFVTQIVLITIRSVFEFGQTPGGVDTSQLFGQFDFSFGFECDFVAACANGN